jgi:hypothetical protein
MSLLAKLADALDHQRAPAPHFDPSVFGDPLATRVNWAPMARGGSSFRTHKAAQAKPGRFEFRATASQIGFVLLFTLVGCVFLLLFLAPLLSWITDQPPLRSLMLLFPVLFLATVSFVWRNVYDPVTFDQRDGWFWKGRTSPSEDPALGSGKNACLLSDIRAIQIVPERIRSKNGSYTSWELNLVLADASRRNVVDHNSEPALLEDARALAEFLSVPIWNHQDGLRPT